MRESTNTRPFLPGFCVLLMTYWWVLPALGLSLLEYPPHRYFASYYLYMLVLAMTALVAAIVTLIERRYRFWTTAGFWGRYLFLCSAHAINVVLIFLVLPVAFHFLEFEFFESDVEGSFLMFLSPSIFLYFGVGAVVGIGKSVLQARRSG